MDKIQKDLLEKIADLHGTPEGAYNIRSNGALGGRNTTANIDIVTKTDKQGIDIIIKPGTKNESVHIPVIISESGLTDLVYNDFFIGEDSDVVIIAGCGIHNCGDQKSEHDGIHTFHVGKNAKLKYVEKHYGDGDGNGENIMNPTTYVELEEGAYLEVEESAVSLEKGYYGLNVKTCGTMVKLHISAYLAVPASRGGNTKASLRTHDDGVTGGVEVHCPCNSEVENYAALKTNECSSKIVNAELFSVLCALTVLVAGVVRILSEESRLVTGNCERLGIADSVKHHIK